MAGYCYCMREKVSVDDGIEVMRNKVGVSKTWAIEEELIKSWVQVVSLCSTMSFERRRQYETWKRARLYPIAILSDFWLSLSSGLYCWPRSGCLYRLYDKLSIGGYVIVNEWFGFPAKTACEDFFKVHGMNVTIVPIDGLSAYWRKSEPIKIQRWRYSQSKFKDLKLINS